jgi:hypothetical protein
MKPAFSGAILIVFVLFSFCLPANLSAGTLPRIEKYLESWQGAKEIQLQTEERDVLGSPELLPLIETFLEYGFAVRPVSEKTASKVGLLAEIRRNEAQTLVVLKRASDNSIVALERMAAGGLKVSETPSPVPITQPPVRQQIQRTEPPSSRKYAPISLEGAFVSLVWLSGSLTQGGDLALLSKNGVSIYHLKGAKLQKGFVAAPPKKNLRPLTLSQGDLNEDGSLELAAVWAEDITSIYEGTDSHIWSQLLGFHKQKLTQLALQPGYVKLFPAFGIVQQRAAHQAFSGPVRQLQYRQGKVSAGGSLSWGKQNIFSLMPWGDGSGLAWVAPSKLETISMTDGTALPGGTLLENFGNYYGTQIAVRLENPEFRSGFEKEDRVYDRYVKLPPRFIRSGKQSILTISRGRKPGKLLIIAPEGQDRLVRLNNNNNELISDYPFEPVEAFIIDFALLSEGGRVGALLLINEKEDATGKAFLLFQTEN